MNAQRVIADLRELAARTSTPLGAQRLAWGPVWRDARVWFKGKVDELGLPIRTDAAGNNWVTLPGVSSRTVIVGSHLDSVPNHPVVAGRVVEDRDRRQSSRLRPERRMAGRLPWCGRRT
jgi:acetylornithine deacetylase/succinyl-diaminopimelate desuccinylase-like protein